MDLNLAFNEEVDAAYDRLKAKHLRWIIFKSNDTQDEVLVESSGERESTFDEFKDAMPKDKPRWAIFEIQITRADGSTGNKILMYHYSPDAYSGPLKFFFATAKAKVESHFVGVNKSC